MQYTFDISKGEKLESSQNPAIQLPKRLLKRQAQLQKEPATIESHKKRMETAAVKRSQIGTFVQENNERQMRAMENRKEFARNFEFLGTANQQKPELPARLQQRAEDLRQKWNIEDHTVRMQAVLSRREKLLAERQQKLEAHNTFAASMPQKRIKMIPSLSDHLRKMAKVDFRRSTNLLNKSRKANKVANKGAAEVDSSTPEFEVFGKKDQSTSSFNLPSKLRKRAENLKRAPMTLDQWNSRMNSVESKRQQFLSTRSQPKKSLESNINNSNTNNMGNTRNMSNIQMWGARKANYVLPAHLQERISTYDAKSKSTEEAAADLETRMSAVAQNRKNFLAQRIEKSKALATTTTTTNAPTTNVPEMLRARHLADMAKVNSQREEFIDDRVGKLQQHLQHVMMVKAKSESKVASLKTAADKDMEVKESNRASFLETVANRARQTSVKAQMVNAEKDKYNANFSMIGNSMNRDIGVKLPVNLQERVSALQNKTTSIPLDLKMAKVEQNRQKYLLQKVEKAKTLGATKTLGAPAPTPSLTPSINTNTTSTTTATASVTTDEAIESKSSDHASWKNRFLSFFS